MTTEEAVARAIAKFGGDQRFVSTKTLNGRTCLEHVNNPDDLQVWGKYGWIWQRGPGSYAAGVINHRIANKYFRQNARKLTRGEEHVQFFSSDSFDVICDILKVARTGPGQLTLYCAWEESLRAEFGPQTEAEIIEEK